MIFVDPESHVLLNKSSVESVSVPNNGTNTMIKMPWI